ncbi:MAG TPA: hypothetical protein VGC49_05935 [Solirubrobacterales bacterium]
MSARRLLQPVLPALVLVLSMLAGSTTPAQGAVYWGAGSFIGAANLDGTMPLISYPYEIANVALKSGVCGVAVDATHLFWSQRNEGTIGVMELSPSISGRLDYVNERVAMDQSLVGGIGGPCGVAVDAAHVYWADEDGFAIGRANLDGSGAETNFVGGVSSPCGVAVDAGHVYWADVTGGTVGRARIDGSEPEPNFITAADHPCGVAVSDTRIYWSDFGGSQAVGGGIGRANLDGSNPEPDFIPTGGAPCGVAVDGSHVYWANDYYPGTRVARANLDGSDARALVSEQSYASVCGIAVDARVFRPPPPPASQPIRFGPLKRRNKGRLLVMPVYVPERGELKVLTPKLGWSLNKGPEPPPWVGGWFRWNLKLWPGSGKAGKWIRRRLARGGWASLDLNISYEQSGRAPSLTEKRIAFGGPPAKYPK